MKDIAELEALLRQCWCETTSGDPTNWTPERPSTGHCAVTALLVQDYFGGDIVWSQVKIGERKISHYFNFINGKEVDLTRDQFPEGTEVSIAQKKTDFENIRSYILFFNDTRNRYEGLKARLLMKKYPRP